MQALGFRESKLDGTVRVSENDVKTNPIFPKTDVCLVNMVTTKDPRSVAHMLCTFFLTLVADETYIKRKNLSANSRSQTFSTSICLVDLPKAWLRLRQPGPAAMHRFEYF